jgi:S1-C subfamily serine protease
MKKLLWFFAGAMISLIILYLSYTPYLSSARDTVVTAPRSDEEAHFIDVYKHTNEGVAFITTVSLTSDPFDIFNESQPREGTGSGAVIDAKRGLILTNLHVVGEDAAKIEVTLADGKNYKAKLIGADPDADIAVLQVQASPSALTEIPLGDSSALQVGQRVLAIGNPFGLNRTLTTGIISSLDRDVKAQNGNILRGAIQTDASINPGNSGGPLLDTAGQLVGINSAILSPSGGSAGIGFAIPVNQIKRILPELISTGHVRRPKVGWMLVDTNQGPLVLRIKEGGPADQAGISAAEHQVQQAFLQGYVRDYRQADLILEINGEPIKNKDQVDEIISKVPQGKSLTLTLRRGGIEGEERKIKLTPLYE